MIQDLHAHTYYSFCGADKPETIAEAAIDGGIELFGITDHSYGIGNARTDVLCSTTVEIVNDYQHTLKRYFDHINLVKEKYQDRIRILRGIEISTSGQGRFGLPLGTDVSYFDYCLLEHIETPETITNKDIFTYAKQLKCPVGIAHTDLFAFIEGLGEDPLAYFTRMARENIFWEMNVNLDTIHKGREHTYMLRFFEDKAQQAIIRKSGVRLSIGFDGHRIQDYKPNRIRDYCQRVTDLGIKLAFAP